MRRREFIALVSGAVAAWPFAARAQEAGRTYRVGGLSGGARNGQGIVAMFDELRRLGFIEGQSHTIEWRQYGPQIELIPELAAELVKARVDVMVCRRGRCNSRGTAGDDNDPDPRGYRRMVEAGLVKSLARPEGNTTGTSILAAELDGKRQEILIEAVPGLRRMAALADSNRTAASRLQVLEDAAHARNIELSIHQIARPERSRQPSMRRRRRVPQR